MARSAASPAGAVRGLDPKAKAQILARLRSIEGHWRAVIRMVDEDRYCIDVIRQIAAVQSAVDKASALLLERHLNHCVTAAIRSDNPHLRERAIIELLDVFEHRRPSPVSNGDDHAPDNG